MDNVVIPGQIQLTELKAFWKKKYPIALRQIDLDRVQENHQCLSRLIEDNKIIYGINTGFGSLSTQIIPKEALSLLQKKLVLSHACGVGPVLDKNIVALILFLKINNLAQAYSGISVTLLSKLIFLLNEGYLPVIPSKGSVGASGDLAPLAHMTLPLIGEGEVFFEGEKISGASFLKQLNWQPYNFLPKEGLALLNGLQVSVAILLDAFFKIEQLFEAALIIGAMTFEAACGNIQAYDSRLQALRQVPGQVKVATVLLQLLERSEIQNHNRPPKRVQDPYCLRCQPQVLGAVLALIQQVSVNLGYEINAVTDNPIIFSQTNEVISGGNFHGEMTSFLADILALALAEIGAISERKVAFLIDNKMSGLPPFLVPEAGLNSGLMIAHVTAAAAASENKALAHPHSVDSLPTSANQEDHVSMATNAALRLSSMIENTSTILAIELIAACQGIDLLAKKSSPALEKIKKNVRKKIAFLSEDRVLCGDIEAAKSMIRDGEISWSTLGFEAIDLYDSSKN